jgi:hypothetical protein
MNDIYHFLKSSKYHLYFFKNAAKKIIIDSFKNSVGWRLKGTPGILIHHLAHL